MVPVSSSRKHRMSERKRARTPFPIACPLRDALVSGRKTPRKVEIKIALATSTSLVKDLYRSWWQEETHDRPCYVRATLRV